METLYERLLSASGSNEKIKILKEYENDDIIKDSLKICYDPYMQSYIKKIPNIKSNGNRNFRQAFPDFKRLFNDLSTRRLSGNLAIETVKMFIRSLNPNTQHLYIKIFQKDLKLKIAEKTLLKAYGDNFIKLFNVQLANKYIEDKNYETDCWFASRKLNGLRGYYSNQKDCVNFDLRTRGGHEMFGFRHILSELNSLREENYLSFIDGEMYSHEIQFQTIQSYVMQEKNINPEHKHKIKFNIFAIGKDWKDTAEMVEKMDNINWDKYNYLTPVKYTIVPNDLGVLSKLMYEFYDDGYEGLMLRHPKIFYNWKRSDYLLKFKPFKEGDFEIVGFEQGKPGGITENTLGAIIIRGEYEQKPIKCNVGSGYKLLPAQGITRDYVWENRDYLLGKTIEVCFQEVTDKPDKNGFYSLQFPTFSKFKLDR